MTCIQIAFPIHIVWIYYLAVVFMSSFQIFLHNLFCKETNPKVLLEAHLPELLNWEGKGEA